MSSIATMVDYLQTLGITTSVDIDWPPEIERVSQAVITHSNSS